MKQKLLLLVFALISTLLNAQSVPMAFEDWKTTAGTQNFFYKNVTKTDKFGNIYVAGATLNALGNTDILLAKYNSSGVQLWIQQYAGAGNGVDFAAGLAVTDSYAYLTGAVTNNTATPETDVITMKYSAAGVLQWASTYNGSGSSLDVGKHIVVDASGNVFITGASYNASLNTDFVSIRYDASGTQQWVSTFDYLGADDASIKIAISGSNLTVSGAVTSAPSTYKFATLTLAQSSGSITATNISSAATTTSVDAVTDFTNDGSGNIIIVGSTYVAGQGKNYYVQKLNSALATVWTYTFNGASSLDDVIRGVQADASGNIYITGYSTSSTQGRNIATMKLNSSGVNQWTQTYNSPSNGNDEAADLVIDASNNIYITGYNTNLLGKTDYYTVKYNSAGTMLWDIISDGTALNDNATNIALDSLNNVIVTGQSEFSPLNFNFLTIKYVQKDIITPTDFNGETPNKNFMYFPNKGQLLSTTLTAMPDVKFHTNSTLPAYYFKDNSQFFVFSKINEADSLAGLKKDTLQRIDLTFFQCNATSKTYAMEQQQKGYLNYFLNYTTSKGIVGVFGNQRLVTLNLYPNIDLMSSSNQNGIKYYFIIKPGGDPRAIQLEYTGATSFSLNAITNDLTIKSSIGEINFDRPTVYQLSATNTTIAVTGWTPDWQLNGASNKYKFNTGTYTTSLTLIIEVDQGNSITSTTSTTDNINWSTYFGKANNDAINKVKTDASKNMFSVGETYSNLIPQAPGASVYGAILAGTMDGFISKFDPLGVLQWSTYVGGGNKDNLVDIAFQSNGDLYCVGNTNSNDIITWSKAGAENDATFHGPTTTPTNWQSDGFIFQLQQDGLTPVWLRYYGGSNLDHLRACAMDNFDNFFITGYSKSSDIPVVYSSGAYHQTNTPVGGAPNLYKGIIARFNSSSAKTWATYIGATTCSTPYSLPNDYLKDIVIAEPSDGATVPDIFVTGYSGGNNYPNVSSVGSSNLTSSSGDLDEGVISRFTNNGNIVWSTYFGGTGNDQPNALAVGDGYIYVTGNAGSTDFLSINSTLDYYQGYGGVRDAFFVIISNSNVITHSTYIGGSNSDWGWDVIYDFVGHVAYISGQTSSSNFPIPTSNPINTYNHSYNGGEDNFICALKHNNTSILWATYLGGTSNEFYGGSGGADSDYHQSICHDGNSKLYLGGVTSTSQTMANPFPLDNGAGIPYFFPSINGGTDGTITRFDLVPVTVVGLQEHQFTANNLLVYPNPSSNLLFVKLKLKSENASYKIYNTMGQVVNSGQLSSEINSINISSLTTGFYVIELTNNDIKYSAKFIKND